MNEEVKPIRPNTVQWNDDTIIESGEQAEEDIRRLSTLIVDLQLQVSVSLLKLNERVDAIEKYTKSIGRLVDKVVKATQV